MVRKHVIVLAGLVLIAAVLAVIVALPEPAKDISLPGLEAPRPYPPHPAETLPFKDRLDSTPLLLHAPVGGFTGPLLWADGPDTLTYEYRFYARGFGPGNVTLTPAEVAAPLSTEPSGPSPGIETRIDPDHFGIRPGEVVTARFNVTIRPKGYSHNHTTRAFRVHADTDLYPNTVADDWIRVRMGDYPNPYAQTSRQAYFDTGDLAVRSGERWSGNLTLVLDERETGPVRVRFKELDCDTVEMSSPDTPQPRIAGWPALSVTPDEFVGRSYGTYNLTAVIDTGSSPVRPGTYCYGAYIDTAATHMSFSFRVRVTP